jgi:hypothetical protein
LKTVSLNKPLLIKNSKKLKDYYLYSASSEYVGNDPNFIPNLLYRHEKGDIIATKNINQSYHWGCELKEAIKNGCHVTIYEINTYTKNKILNPLKFSLISKDWKINLCALGGIAKKNLNRINLLKVSAIAFHRMIFD